MGGFKACLRGAIIVYTSAKSKEKRKTKQQMERKINKIRRTNIQKKKSINRKRADNTISTIQQGICRWSSFKHLETKSIILRAR